MTIEVANKLLELRKKSGMSQEELADKLGISRQSISKWERAESSPDTDNLIALAKIYNVSLDEILLGKESALDEEFSKNEQEEDIPDMGTEFIHVDDENSTVRIGTKGIYVNERSKNNEVRIDENGIYVNGEPKNHVFTRGKNKKGNKFHDLSVLKAIPYPIVAAILYIVFGFAGICGGWDWGWIVFLTIPLYYTLIDSIEYHNPEHFFYPVFALIIFFLWGNECWFGIGYRISWVVFLTIPIYYSICGAIKNESKKKQLESDNL
ncbi:MAG: helix-turn-helix transcriptional regulator [Ruminococcus sp.]|nr:helix-turn-helix transcriptional regulator [Ruminococcus sp.]